MTDAEHRKLDAEIATKIMGLTVIDVPFVPNKIKRDEVYFTDEAARQWRLTYPNGCSVRLVPGYSTSLDACAIAERKTEEKGLVKEYGRALVVEVVGQWIPTLAPGGVWLVATAEPDMRCRAMLAAKGAA